MDRQEIIEEIRLITEEITDNEVKVLTDNTKANEIEGWDSLAHIQIVVMIERKFDIKFDSDEISDWGSIGEIVNSITKHLE